MDRRKCKIQGGRTRRDVLDTHEREIRFTQIIVRQELEVLWNTQYTISWSTHDTDCTYC